MQSLSLQEFGVKKFTEAGLIASSHGRRWDNVSVELRCHAGGDISPPLPTQMELTLAVKGSSSVVRRRADRHQQTVARRGTLWFCPIGVHEEEINLSGEIPEVLHLYIPRSQFLRLSEIDGLASVDPVQIDYLAGVDDELIRQIGWRLLEELSNETAGGPLLVEMLVQALAAHLTASYTTGARGLGKLENAGLDPRRLARVIDFMRDNVANSISVADLAGIACLSRHHFSRAFQRATGSSPHRYLSELRFESARHLLDSSSTSIAQIALQCQFSSQSAFTRAFHRSAGLSPSDYRRAAWKK